MTAFGSRFAFDPAASVAAMQEQERNSLKIVAAPDIRSNFGWMFASNRSIRFRLTISNVRWRAVDRFQSACNMQYGAGVRRLNPLTRAKRRWNGDPR
jgi:hypothetical protein